MDAQQFLSEFAHIASAPNGVQQLRELSLQLAVSGRLVQRELIEGTVEDALIEAEHLRDEYEINMKLQRSKSYPILLESEYPYTIPSHWRWQRLEQIACYIQRGKSPSYAPSGSTLVISQKCIQRRGFDLSLAQHIDDTSATQYSKERFLQHGDLLLNSTGTGTVGRVVIYNEKGKIHAVADSHVTVIRLSNFVPYYILCVIAAPWFQARIDPGHENSIVSGTTKQVELATNSVKKLAIPCPPLAEQKRIVAKVDELMALCDKLEAQHQERESLRYLARFNTSQKLIQSRSSQETTIAWSRLQEHMRLLFDGEKSTHDTKQVVRELAIRGYYSQSKSSVPPRELTSLVLQGKKPLTEIDIDWLVPNDWMWCRLGWLGESRLGKMLDNAKNKGELRPYLRNINVRWRQFDLNDLQYMLTEEHELSRISVSKGDLVICEGGEPGRAAIWQDPNDIIIQKALHRFRCGCYVIPEYVLLCLETDFFSKRLTKFYTGVTIKHLTGKSLSMYPIPVPPLDEQKRIVKQVDEIVSLLNLLEVQLYSAQEKASEFTKIAITKLTGIQIEDKEKMKAPKTELISTLRIGISPNNKDHAPFAAILLRNNGELPARTLWSISGFEEIDAFYQQLKTEMSKGWIVQPEVAYMKEVESS